MSNKIEIERFKSESSSDDTYTCLVLMFNQISIMAMNKCGGWVLSKSFTDHENNECITEYSNGKMTIKAHSLDGEHYYVIKSN